MASKSLEEEKEQTGAQQRLLLRSHAHVIGLAHLRHTFASAYIGVGRFPDLSSRTSGLVPLRTPTDR
jgi:hypothetical protein